MTCIPFNLIAAFSKDSFGGNPAAVAFLDKELPVDILSKIAVNFNQPITCFVSGPQQPSQGKTAVFSIRWFLNSGHTIPICGHGTMAAAKAIFERGLVSDDVGIIEFHTVASRVMKARKTDGGLIEIQLPSTFVEELAPPEHERISASVRKAFGKDVAINFIGKGGKGFETYVLVELDKREDLGACKVLVAELVSAQTIALI